MSCPSVLYLLQICSEFTSYALIDQYIRMENGMELWLWIRMFVLMQTKSFTQGATGCDAILCLTTNSQLLRLIRISESKTLNLNFLKIKKK